MNAFFLPLLLFLTFVHLARQEFETTLDEDDFTFARFLPIDEDDTDILEKQGYFEGDIKVKQNSQNVQRDAPSFLLGLLPIISRYSLWPDGRIPYTLSSRYTRYQRGVIAQAMREYEEKTCIKFVPRKGERDYVYIFKDDGCYSLVGKVRGRQELSLDDDCVRKGVVIHELMHTVGFFHEQSRFDRDQFVDIVYDNIIPGTHDQFQKYKASKIDSLGVGYDYGSVLHYGPTAFSKNGRSTIVPKQRNVRIGQRRGFSQKDVQKINALYKCPASRKPSRPTQQPARSTRRPLPATAAPGGGFLTPPCKDIATNCRFFKDRCFKRSIKDYCQKTCGGCPSASENNAFLGSFVGIETGTSRSPGFLGSDVCEDAISDRDCKALARENHCKIDRFKGYMRKYCCRTCGF